MTKFSLLALLLWPVTLPAVDLPPWAENLAADAQVSVQARKPVVVMFRSEECPYCEIVLKHYLGPLAEDPDYRNRVQIRVVDVDGHDLQLTGFDGHLPLVLMGRHRCRARPTRRPGLAPRPASYRRGMAAADIQLIVNLA